MYGIHFKGSKVKKQFLKLNKKLSEDVKKRLRNTLENKPYPNPTYREFRSFPSKVEKKGSLYCYEVTGSDRVLYDIVEKPIKAVLVYYAGNDDGEIRFLKKYSK